MRLGVWRLSGPCPGVERGRQGARGGVGRPVGEIAEATPGTLLGDLFSLLHLSRAMPPPPPTSAMGTVGADVCPASGRDRVGGQQGLGQGTDRNAGRAPCPGVVGGGLIIITTDQVLSPYLFFLGVH